MKTRLVADRTAIAPGRKFRLGVLFEIPEGSHIYWKNPGDAGLAPEVKFNLPEGFRTGPLFWPAPERMLEPGDLVVNVYHDRVLLYAWVVPPPELKPGAVSLKASSDWLVCRKVCVQENAADSLILPVGEGGPSQDIALFSAFERRVPRPAEQNPGLSLEASWGEPVDGATDRLGVITLSGPAQSAPLVDSVRELLWFDNPSDNIVSQDLHIDREHSSLDRLVLHLSLERLEPSLAWPESWGGVLVARLAGSSSDSLELRLEVKFEDSTPR
ncbi:hypothetical protein LLH00_19235 [bacterium]|nr:hypothetical protein [bacterium]